MRKNVTHYMSILLKKIVFGACIACAMLGVSSCRKMIIKDEPMPTASNPLPNPGPNWVKMNAPNDTITVLEEFNNVIYAASNSNTLYTSVDHGASWATVKVGAGDVNITAIRVFNGKIYLGTGNNGIFSSSDGRNWTNYVNGFQDYNYLGQLVGYPISSFAVSNNTLYVSTRGNGVRALNQSTGNWDAFNNGLPQIITSFEVFKMLSSNNTLVAAAGVNATFYYYNFNSGQWIESALPHIQTYIDKMIIDNGTLYGHTSEGKIIRSVNNGLSWDYDTNDLHNAQALNYKELYCGTTKDYVLSVSFGSAENGTTVQQRDKNAALGSTWANGQEFLEGIHAHAMLEDGGKLFLGTDHGLYVKSI